LCVYEGYRGVEHGVDPWVSIGSVDMFKVFWLSELIAAVLVYKPLASDDVTSALDDA